MQEKDDLVQRLAATFAIAGLVAGLAFVGVLIWAVVVCVDALT